MLQCEGLSSLKKCNTGVVGKGSSRFRSSWMNKLFITLWLCEFRISYNVCYNPDKDNDCMCFICVSQHL